MCVCARVYERERVCLCVCARERVCVWQRMCVCVEEWAKVMPFEADTLVSCDLNHNQHKYKHRHY